MKEENKKPEAINKVSPETISKNTGIPLYTNDKLFGICPRCGKMVTEQIPCDQSDCPIGKHIQLNS